MIDLHTHTNYSDGTWNVKKLLREAEKAKIALEQYEENMRVEILDCFD